MLEKTFAMVKDLAPGEYISDELRVYDEDEVRELAQLLNSIMYSPSQLRRALQRLGVTLVPANFYSPVPMLDDVEASSRGPSLQLDRIFTDAVLREKLESMVPFADEFAPVMSTAPGAFRWDGPFSHADAPAYYAMIRSHKPRTVLEIGSGASTIVALTATDRNGHGRVVCIEPLANDYLDSLKHRIEWRRMRAQELEIDWLNDTLQDGDFLFIDSTHTVKHDSDCIHLYLRLLPALRRRIFVHAHDIHLPNTQRLRPLRDLHIYWTEQYLLYAYLLGNARTEVVYSSEWHDMHNHGRLTRFVNGKTVPGGGSLWFSQAPE